MVPQWVSQKGPSSPQLVATGPSPGQQFQGSFRVFSMDRALSSSQMHARSPGMAKHGCQCLNIHSIFSEDAMKIISRKSAMKIFPM